MPPLDAPEALQHASELAAMLDIYRARQPKRVLEIGTYAGGTLYHWLQARPETVVAIDDFKMWGHPRDWPAFHDWAPEGTRLEMIVGNSQATATLEIAQGLGPFDWAFIDADHSYRAVSRDWNRYRWLCTGVIALHDIVSTDKHPEIQVSRLWRQIKAQGYKTLELIEDPNQDWGGIGLVFLND